MPENAVAVQRIIGDIDVLSRLSEVAAPTLVIHAEGDRQVPFEQGRQLASLIKGARLFPVDSQNHLLLESEPGWRTAWRLSQHVARTHPARYEAEAQCAY